MLPDLKSIKKRREGLGWRQYAFAKAAGISQSMLAKIENGSADPSYENAVKIFDKLDELEHKGEKTVGEIMHKGVVILMNTDTVGKAAALAKEKGISQFPLLRGENILGSIRTRNLIGFSEDTKIGLLDYDPPFPTVDANTPVSVIVALVKAQQAIVVVKEGKMAGIITAEDLL